MSFLRVAVIRSNKDVVIAGPSLMKTSIIRPLRQNFQLAFACLRLPLFELAGVHNLCCWLKSHPVVGVSVGGIGGK